MHRPPPMSGAQQLLVKVDGAQKGEASVVLTEKSLFGSTSMTFHPETARQVAQKLLRAADAAEGKTAEETSERRSVPKLAAVR